MHHIYTRRIVIALVLLFAVMAILFGPLVVSLRLEQTPAGAACDCAEPEQGSSAAFTLPDGEATFNDYCTSCHQAQKFADKLKSSLDADAASRAQLEKLIGPPAHGGVSPAEALAVVISLRTMAGLPSTYPDGVPTPAAAATAAAAAPTPTQIPWANLSPGDYEGIFNQYCSACHQAETFAEGLKGVPDPNTRSRQAVDYLSGPPSHQNLPTKAMKPAINYIRRLAGLDPIR
jgi:mono/diheme cytochrome c family protein